MVFFSDRSSSAARGSLIECSERNNIFLAFRGMTQDKADLIALNYVCARGKISTFATVKLIRGTRSSAVKGL